MNPKAMEFNDTDSAHLYASLRDLPLAFRVTVCVVTVIFTLLTLGGNVMCIVAFIKCKDFKNSTGYFFLSLAICDLGMSPIMASYTYSVLYGEWPYGKIVCDISGFARGSLVTNSILHVFFLSFDTFLAVFKPLRHRHILTLRRCIIILTCSWIYVICLFMLPFFGIGEFTFLEYTGHCIPDSLKSRTFFFIFILSVILPVLAVYVLNAWIWCIARGGRKRLRVTGNSSCRIHREAMGVDQQRRSTVKASKTILLILLFFTCTSMIMYVMHTIQCFHQVRIPTYIAVIGTYMGLANHWINIFIYTYVNRKVKITLERIFFAHFKSGKNVSNECSTLEGSTSMNSSTEGLSCTDVSMQVWSTNTGEIRGNP